MSPVSTYIMGGKVKKRRKRRPFWLALVLLLVLAAAGIYWIYNNPIGTGAQVDSDQARSTITPAPMVRTQDTVPHTPNPATTRATNPVARIFSSYQTAYAEGVDKLGYQSGQLASRVFLPWQLRASVVNSDILFPQKPLSDLTQEGNGWTGENASVQTTEAGKYAFELKITQNEQPLKITGEMNLQNNSLYYEVLPDTQEQGDVLGYAEIVQSQNGFIAQYYSATPPYQGVTRFFITPDTYAMSIQPAQSYADLQKAFANTQLTFEQLSANDPNSLMIQGNNAFIDGKAISPAQITP